MPSMKTSILLGILLVIAAFVQAETAPIERIDRESVARALADGEQAGVWEQRRSFLHGRIFHSAVWAYPEMIVWGGAHLSEGDTINVGLKTGAAYNPDTNAWQSTTLENAPDGRMYHVAIWSGQEMIVWGGGDQPQGNFPTGGRYHPTTHQWTPTANTNAPIGRGIATAVWTGEGMLIYGGSTGGVAAFNETYYYRPHRPSVIPNPAAEK